ncbi:MAG: 23S rRNA (guanosine(2251)-2'-O)-methyltransferase RlmB [Pseudomonadota bacterium]
MKHSKNKHKGHKGQKSKSARLNISLFGFHAVAEAWLNPKRHIHALFITESALYGFEETIKKAKNNGLKRPEPQIIDKNSLDSTTPPGTVHQGIALSCQNLEEVDTRDIIIKDQNKERSILVMLDQVTDPHNVGAILRSASVFGASGLIMQDKHAPDLTGTLAKTACGAVEHVPVAYETNLTRTLELLQKEGYFAIALDERGETEISELPIYKRCVLVLGAEGDGLRRLVREQCDVLTRLDSQGPIPCLNVSNAAAVALYAMAMK